MTTPEQRRRLPMRVRPWTCLEAEILLKMAGFGIESLMTDSPSGQNLYAVARKPSKAI